MSEGRNCSNCKFFHPQGETGECRRKAPAVLHVPEVERLTQKRALRAISYWPPIVASEWCGEHEPDFQV
jgi:hypothetical protein